MKLGAIATLAGLLVLVGGGTFWGYHYTEHLKDFNYLWSETTCTVCLRECHETCQANGIPLDKCDCKHCYTKYCGGTG